MPKELVVVTGASHGIGLAVAKAFAALGHALLLAARHPVPLDGFSHEQIRLAEVDVADYAALAAAIGEAEKAFGPTACLVNNAGFLQIAPLAERDVSEMSYEIDVLFKGVLHGIRAVLPGMIQRKSGTIINLSSIADRVPGPTGEIYHASKAAVRSLGLSLQKDLAASNVRIVNIAPGFVKTSIHEHMGITFDEYRQRLGDPVFISADELADIIMFCWRQPPHICIRDLVVMPTSSSFG